jgi:ABC-type transport system involved in multi-copper enzyme maturation permease subunit
VTLPRVIRSEWIKFRSLRSTVSVLGAAMVGMVVIGLLVAYHTRQLNASIQPDDAVPSATLQGYFLGQLLIGALGVLFVSGEYSTGMFRSTFAAVPTRLPVLWAKLAVFVCVTAVAMVAMSVVAFVSAQALISGYRPGYSLGDPGVLRVVIGTGIYLTIAGVIGACIAWVVRSTPGSLVTYIAVMLVVPGLLGSVFGRWGKDVAQFLPSEAGGSFVGSIRQPVTLTPWIGLLVMALWAVVGLAVAAVRLTRRDA